MSVVDENDPAWLRLAKLLESVGAKVTVDPGRSIFHPCTFCGQPPVPHFTHELMTIGRYLNGAKLTRPVCDDCKILVTKMEEQASSEKENLEKHLRTLNSIDGALKDAGIEVKDTEAAVHLLRQQRDAARDLARRNFAYGAMGDRRSAEMEEAHANKLNAVKKVCNDNLAEEDSHEAWCKAKGRCTFCDPLMEVLNVVNQEMAPPTPRVLGVSELDKIKDGVAPLRRGKWVSAALVSVKFVLEGAGLMEKVQSVVEERGNQASDEAVQKTAEYMMGLVDRYRLALLKINIIRNSIVGLQTLNWSEHIYPLVAALNEAGMVGMEYDDARPYFGTMLERTNLAEEKEAKLRSAVKALAEKARTLIDDFTVVGTPSCGECASVDAVVYVWPGPTPHLKDSGHRDGCWVADLFALAKEAPGAG